MSVENVEIIEVDLLLEGIFRRYGYDFRSYARASLERRIRTHLSQEGMTRISELIPWMLHSEEHFSKLARWFSISVTEMFRDPPVFVRLRRDIMPLLKTFPFVKVWAAGCATGEEVYSLAVVFAETGMLPRSTIFGTDFNDESLRIARQGVYAADRIQDFTRNYQESGGTKSFADYYHARAYAATLAASLKKHITFANHNLATDQVFSEMHLILCRNVLIYFNRQLQDRALRLFADSLVHGGFLVLGSKESLQFSSVADQFEIVDTTARIYKKVSSALLWYRGTNPRPVSASSWWELQPVAWKLC